MNVTQQINAGQWLEFTEVGDFFRLMEAPDRVTVLFYVAGKEVGRAVEVQEGYAEVFDKGGFDRVRVASGTTQTISFVTRQGSRVFYDTPPVGDVNIVSPVEIAAGQSLALVPATIASLKRPGVPTGSWTNTTAMVANTAKQVFAPAANVNGAILHAASANEAMASSGFVCAFLAKASAPANVADGDPLLIGGSVGTTGSVYAMNMALPYPQFIPAGQGLYYISSTAPGGARGARYEFL